MKKKIWFLCVGLSCCALAYADRTIDLNDPKVELKCGNYVLTPNSTSQDIKTHCTTINYKIEGVFRKNEIIKLLMSDGEYMNCKVMNNKLKTCKVQD